MMRLTVVPLLCLCLCLSALPAVAAATDAAAQVAGEGQAAVDNAAALDLMLPQAPVSPYRNDPPGTWYGDRSGVPAPVAGAASGVRSRVGCPTAPDGSERDLTGSVSAGVGYSSSFGNSNYQAADLGYCNTYFNDDGEPRTINVQMHMGTYDGAIPAPGPWSGPRRPGLYP